MRVSDAILEGATLLAGIPDGDRDAEGLLRFVLGLSRADVLARPERPLSAPEEARFRGLVALRARRVPLQHLLGRQAFWHHEFKVTGDVLIPRPETEILVAAALEALAGRRAPRIVDVGTGTGCIGLSLAASIPDAEVHLVDISEPALGVARENARALGVLARATFHLGDLLGPFRGWGPSFDLVASNPPYVAAEDLPTLAPEVRDHEPRVALVPPGDRASLYRRLAPEAAALLAPGGTLLVEIGAGMEAEVRAILSSAGFVDLAALQDLQGIPRTIAAHYRRRGGSA
jgi:release factor glutamine methyltransferase